MRGGFGWVGPGTDIAAEAEAVNSADGATDTADSGLEDVASEGVPAVEDGTDTFLVTWDPATGGVASCADTASLMDENEGARPELAIALPTLPTLPAVTEGGFAPALRLCTRDPVCEAEAFGEVVRGDELESGELEPAVVPASSAAAIAGDTVRATPTPAVTAPT